MKELARIEKSSICRQQFANLFADCFCSVHTRQPEFTNTSLTTLVCRVKAALGNNNNNNFYLNVTEWLVSPGGTKFSKPTGEMSKEELNVFRNSFCTSAGNRDGTLSVLQKFINEIHLRAAIDRFLRSLPLNKPFSTISDPAFTEANKALGHLQKSSEKQATLPAY